MQTAQVIHDYMQTAQVIRLNIKISDFCMVIISSKKKKKKKKEGKSQFGHFHLINARVQFKNIIGDQNIAKMKRKKKYFCEAPLLRRVPLCFHLLRKELIYG